MSLSRRSVLAYGLFGPVFFSQIARPWASPPTRVVSLGGDVTEIVYSLGESARLVARDSTSTYPNEANSLPNVGYFRQLGAEGVLSLRPDALLASASSGPPEALKQISSIGVRIVSMPDDHSPDGLIRKVDLIAKTLELGNKGQAFIKTLEAALAEAQTIIANLKAEPRVLFLINAGNGAPMAAGRNTAANALIGLAKGTNVFADHTGYKPISLEAAAAAAPDAIALMDQTLAAMGGVDALAEHPALRLTPAARTRRIVARDGIYLLGFGPRLPSAMVDFAKAIRGIVS